MIVVGWGVQNIDTGQMEYTFYVRRQFAVAGAKRKSNRWRKMRVVPLYAPDSPKVFHETRYRKWVKDSAEAEALA